MSVHAVSNTLVQCLEESPPNEALEGTLRVQNGTPSLHNGLFWTQFPTGDVVVNWCVQHAKSLSKTLYFRILESLP